MRLMIPSSSRETENNDHKCTKKKKKRKKDRKMEIGMEISEREGRKMTEIMAGQ